MSKIYTQASSEYLRHADEFEESARRHWQPWNIRIDMDFARWYRRRANALSLTNFRKAVKK